MKEIEKRKLCAIQGIYGGAIPPDVKAAIERADFSELEQSRMLNFSQWLEALPNKPLKGLNDECYRYVNCWGSGGGSQKVEHSVKEAFMRSNSENPREIAKMVFDTIYPTVLSATEATVFVMDMIVDSMLELEAIIELGGRL